MNTPYDFSDNINITSESDTSLSCNKETNNGVEETIYGIRANKGGGSSISDESVDVQVDSTVASDKKTAQTWGRHFDTYNCQYCEGEVRIVAKGLDSNNRYLTDEVTSTYLKEEYPNSNPFWLWKDYTNVCEECRSGCFTSCNDGCDGSCVQGLQGCRVGNS